MSQPQEAPHKESKLPENQQPFKHFKKDKEHKCYQNFVQEGEQILNDPKEKLSSAERLEQGQLSESQEEEAQRQVQDIVKQLEKKDQKEKANAKMVVGTGFSFDITQFFKFEKKKRLDSKEGDLFAEISGGFVAWIILLYSVLNASMIPAWIMNIKATKLLRISWRFMLQSIMVIPFVLYERRISSEEVKGQYSLRHIFKPAHLKKVYISALSTSFWFTCILTVFEWTYISHGLVLGSLSNFFLSIHRSAKKSSHDLEPGGQVMVILGVILVVYDSYSLNPSTASTEDRQVINPFYLSREWYQRVMADLVALFVSFSMARFSQYTSDMKSHYPPYLSMLLVNVFMWVNMMFSAYFFNGLTFDFDTKYGVLSIFSQEHFASFLYMAIILCFGMFISFALVSKLFQDPIIPALAMTLDPILASFLVEVFGVQTMPHAVSFVGYLFIIPGLLLILIGQCLFQRIKAKQDSQLKQRQAKKTQEILTEVRSIKKMSSLEKRKTIGKLKKLKEQLEDEQSHKSNRFQNSQDFNMVKTLSKKSLNEPLIEQERHNSREIYSSLEISHPHDSPNQRK